MIARTRILSLLLALTLFGCHRGGVEITHGRITLPPPGMAMTAGYFTIENDTALPVEVRAISSASFESIGMHETRTENGVSSMHALPQLLVPPRGRVTFEPGGKHLMMFKPKAALESGTRVAVVFTLAAGDGTESKIEATFVAGEAGP